MPCFDLKLLYIIHESELQDRKVKKIHEFK